MGFEFRELAIKGVYVITPQVFGDSRGYFMETYKKDVFAEHGITGEFVQDNESFSAKGVLRGLHFQTRHTQGKLVRVTSGRVYDVAVDVRPGSETFGQWVGEVVDAEKKHIFWIPPGFAHGFLVLSNTASFVYKCTDIYDPSSEGGIPWDDPDVAVAWPQLDVAYKTSEKDRKYPGFREQDFGWAGKYLCDSSLKG